MTKYAVIQFKEAENTIDAINGSESRLELLNCEIHNNVAEAYEKLVKTHSEGIEAIVLSEEAIRDLYLKLELSILTA